MLKKFRDLFIALTLISFTTVFCSCSFSLPWIPAPPSTNNSTEPITEPSIEPTIPEWTFPSDNAHPAQPLPDITSVVTEAMPSVVSVTTEMTVYDIFNEAHKQTAAGSGFLIHSEEGDEGYIVTNNHVVQGAKSVRVELSDDRSFPADVVGTDTLTDLAVLKIDATELPYAHLGNSDTLAIGDWAVAIGNALGEGISATHGIISRLDVEISVHGNALRGLIQTDAPINPGNSGGPLVNISGEVIGITSVKMAAAGVEGMGYAISINSAKPIIKTLIEQGYVSRPWLGVALYTVDPYVAAANGLSVNEGAFVVELVSGSPADIAGLREGDVIVRFGDKKITNVDDIVQTIHNSQIGQKVEITFFRGESSKTVWAQLQESPAPQD
ncbi:MAG: trypsin-like peptidase domain-containing protein [Dehalococcoidia bacterium]|nr:trypsin-like peptidase domain-containing protein [Dehalococcoidia bacterium]